MRATEKISNGSNLWRETNLDRNVFVLLNASLMGLKSNLCLQDGDLPHEQKIANLIP